jgi:hypothetical protein
MHNNQNCPALARPAGPLHDRYTCQKFRKGAFSGGRAGDLPCRHESARFQPAVTLGGIKEREKTTQSDSTRLQLERPSHSKIRVACTGIDGSSYSGFRLGQSVDQSPVLPGWTDLIHLHSLNA